mgnify:CR=1 FL=1
MRGFPFYYSESIDCHLALPCAVCYIEDNSLFTWPRRRFHAGKGYVGPFRHFDAADID